MAAAMTACGSPGTPTARGPARSSTTATQTTLSSTTAAAPAAPSPCVGLSICPPPPPDAQGNPACYYADGWRAFAPEAGIEVWYFHEPQNMAKPDKLTAMVRRKDGTTESQDADIAPGQQAHRFEFPDVTESSVDEVLLTSSTGRCFVIGPGG